MDRYDFQHPAPLAQARSAYERLLRSGIGSDRELSRSQDYRSFLSAGMEILRHGGSSAVRHASSTLIAEIPGAEAAHFERLWDGLMTEFGTQH